MTKGIKIFLVVLFVLMAMVGSMAYTVIKSSTEKMDAMVDVDIDMAQVADGTYNGYSDGGLVKAEVQVTVENHQITNIDLIRHEFGQGAPAEAILEDMIKQNTDKVDAVSGATVSSKTIRNAVNKALKKGIISKG